MTYVWGRQMQPPEDTAFEMRHNMFMFVWTTFHLHQSFLKEQYFLSKSSCTERKREMQLVSCKMSLKFSTTKKYKIVK